MNDLKWFYNLLGHANSVRLWLCGEELLQSSLLSPVGWGLPWHQRNECYGRSSWSLRPFTLCPALFLSPCQKFLSVETSAVRPHFLAASEIWGRNCCFSVFLHSEETPRFEESQLVHGISLIWGGNAFLQHPTSLWNDFLYYSLEIVCNTVPMSLLSGDMYHVKRYPQLEIHSQILLPLLCHWRG